MDDAQLKKLLGDAPVPPADDNARKVALNLALAEFEKNQKSENNLQGKGLWGRLTHRTHSTRREKMNKKYIYGGMATAMVLVLATAVTMQNGPIYTRSGGGDATVSSTQNMASMAKPELQALGQASVQAPAQADAESQAAISYEMADANTARATRAAPGMERAVKMLGMPAPAMAPAMELSVAPAAPQGGMAFALPGEPMPPSYYAEQGRDKFDGVEENPVKMVAQEAVSTFSIDVDTSSYAFVRRQLNSGVLPQKDAVRVEEMVNYFDYDYALPEDKAQPFKPTVTVVPSPWNAGRKLVHIGIKGYDVAPAQAPDSNLVFLLDTSGSMYSPDKLPLLISSLKMLLDTLKPTDTISIVTYAGSAGVALEPTKVSEKAKIIAALEGLNAGGSTAGAEGIRQAYSLAESNFNKEAVNRVLLATDGDFNVGITDQKELQDFIERKRDSGIYLSVLGFGAGNYNDAMMQTLAQNGNGVAAYIDTLNEARKVLVEEAQSTLFPIARDVKIQVEFNPATVAEYRLVGYETRALNREDFNNDKVDAGDIGAGHTVTAIYEITPVGGPRAVDDSRYAATAEKPAAVAEGASKDVGQEYAFLKIRYKLPQESESKLITTPITPADEKPFANTKCPPNAQCLVADELGASDDVRFSVAVAGFAQLLKGSKYTGSLSYDDVINTAQGAKGSDEFGYRAEFINLVRLAKTAQAMP